MALRRIAFCVRLSFLAMVAISFEASIDDRSSSSSSGVHKRLCGTLFRLQPQLASRAFETETAPSHGELEPPTHHGFSRGSFGGWDRRSVINLFPAKLFLSDRRLYLAP